ncbi:hypothetical protein VNO80_16498 [Phaseolus coccineus]|uniref:Uncharacterized protein n=1 Tax=Phaseolus coccineus TaxID=3886 RepID=A0AAN9R401_PHACN
MQTLPIDLNLVIIVLAFIFFFGALIWVCTNNASWGHVPFALRNDGMSSINNVYFSSVVYTIPLLFLKALKIVFRILGNAFLQLCLYIQEVNKELIMIFGSSSQTESTDSSSPLNQGNVGSNKYAMDLAAKERAERVEENWSVQRAYEWVYYHVRDTFQSIGGHGKQKFVRTNVQVPGVIKNAFHVNKGEQILENATIGVSNRFSSKYSSKLILGTPTL